MQAIIYVSEEPLMQMSLVYTVEMQAIMYVLEEPLMQMSVVYTVWKRKQ